MSRSYTAGVEHPAGPGPLPADALFASSLVHPCVPLGYYDVRLERLMRGRYRGTSGRAAVRAALDRLHAAGYRLAWQKLGRTGFCCLTITPL